MEKLEVISFDNIKIKENSYQLLTQLLSKETHLNFEYYQRNFIERRIKARMIRVKCQRLDDYYNYLLSNPSEIQKFLDNFNINYTYFFRNFTIFERFQELILKSIHYKGNKILGDLTPKLSEKIKKRVKSRKNRYPKKRLVNTDFKKWHHEVSTSQINKLREQLDFKEAESKGIPYLKQTSLYNKINNVSGSSKTPIYIWSCPCASGEEPYSIAMIMDNLKSQFSNFPNYTIVASDIDSTAIYKAKAGVYNDDSTKELSIYYEDKYFTKTKNYFGFNYTINEKIKNDVELITEDVTKGHRNPLKYDIIFCRYLLIYINREKRDKFLKIIENRLNFGGLLILGKTETLFKVHNGFKLVDAKNHIYIKTN